MVSDCDAVEFVGGPFDGLLQFVSGPPVALKRFSVFLVNSRVVKTLDGFTTGPTSEVTSVAVYQLQYASSGLHYQYLGTIAPSRIELTD